MHVFSSSFIILFIDMSVRIVRFYADNRLCSLQL